MMEMIKRVASVNHTCQQNVFMNGCGKTIKSGQAYFQTKNRIGVDKQQRCWDCEEKAAIARATGGKDE